MSLFNSILYMITFHKSYATRFIVSISYISVSFLSFVIIFGNPFTSEIHEINDYNTLPRVDDYYIITTPSNIDSNEKYIIPNLDDMYIEYSINDILPFNNSVTVYDESEYTLEEAELDEAIFIVELDSLRNYNVHPLPFFTKSVTNNDIFILGTDENGLEFFNNIIYNLKNTFYLTLYAIVGFLFFGLFFGIITGYYNNKKIANFFIFFQKMIESVPLILWVLVTSVLVNEFILNENFEWPLTYFMFGFFSSTALSKLIAEKINSLRNKDFIVALKLLGLSDLRIIFNHIIRFYCFDIILFQLINIIAQSIFLNITLCIIEFTQINTIGMMFKNAFHSRSDTYGSINLFVISILIYFLMSSLFYTARYFRVKS